jgi:hypothetical protein
MRCLQKLLPDICSNGFDITIHSTLMKTETMKYVVISAVLSSVFPATAASRGTKARQPANAKFQEVAVQKTRLKFTLHMVVWTAAPSSAGTFANHRDYESPAMQGAPRSKRAKEHRQSLPGRISESEGGAACYR